MKQTAVCPECGTTFLYYPSWPRKYCSRRCSGLNNARNLGEHLQGATVNLQCEQCGKVFSRSSFEVTKVKHHFCSRRCFGDHQKDVRTGVPRPEMRGERPDLQNRVEKVCKRCGKHFWVKASHATRRVMCSRACQSNRVQKDCEWCGMHMDIKACHADMRFCSKPCHVAYQKTLKGAQTNNWRGGYDGRYGPNWKQQRRNARQRDHYTCQRCGVDEIRLGKQLDVHHITPFRLFGIARYKEANSLSNLISVCPTCHKQIENHAPFGVS